MFHRQKIWLNKKCLCELEEDGTVTYREDVTCEDLKALVGCLLRELESMEKKTDGKTRVKAKA